MQKIQQRDATLLTRIIIFLMIFLIIGCADIVDKKAPDLRSPIAKDKIRAAKIITNYKKEERIVRLLIDGLRDEDREAVIDALCDALRHQGKIAVEPLGEFLLGLKNDILSVPLRAKVAETLGRIGDRKAIKILKKMQDDSAKEVQEAVKKALENLGYF